MSELHELRIHENSDLFSTRLTFCPTMWDINQHA